MSEPAVGKSAIGEVCQHFAALTQAVKSLQDGYTQLEQRVQSLAIPASTTATTEASSMAGTATTAPSVVMLPSSTRKILRGPWKIQILLQRMSVVLRPATSNFLAGIYQREIYYFITPR